MPAPYQITRYPAPRGQKSAYDVASVPLDYALLLKGQFPARQGKCQGLIGPVYANNYAYSPVSVWHYRGNSASQDRIVVVVAGGSGAVDSCTFTLLTSGTVPYYEYLNVVTRTRMSVTLPGISGRYWGAQFDDELIIVGDGGIRPYRYYVDATNTERLYKCGIDTPAAPTLGAAAGGALTGTFSWLVVYKDERGRRSARSATVSATLAAQQQTLNFSWGGDYKPGGQVSEVEIYRSLAGVPGTYYLVTTITNTATTAYTDNNTDAAISGNRVCDPAGYNAPPANASAVAVWNRRLVMNKVDTTLPTAASTLQISNRDTPTQYSPSPDTANLNSGMDFLMGELGSDQVMGFFPVGGYLVTLKQTSVHVLHGDDSLSWYSRRMHTKGALSGSLSALPNGGAFVSNDGVYLVLFDGSFSLCKLSDDINDLFYTYDTSGVSNVPLENYLVDATLAYLNGRLYLSHNTELAIGAKGRTLVCDLQNAQIAGGGASGMGAVAGHGWADANITYIRAAAPLMVAQHPDSLVLGQLDTLSSTYYLGTLSEVTRRDVLQSASQPDAGWRWRLPPPTPRAPGQLIHPLRLILFGQIGIYGTPYLTGQVNLYNEAGDISQYSFSGYAADILEAEWGRDARLVVEFRPDIEGSVVYAEIYIGDVAHPTYYADLIVTGAEMHWA